MNETKELINGAVIVTIIAGVVYAFVSMSGLKYESTYDAYADNEYFPSSGDGYIPGDY